MADVDITLYLNSSAAFLGRIHFQLYLDPSVSPDVRLVRISSTLPVGKLFPVAPTLEQMLSPSRVLHSDKQDGWMLHQFLLRDPKYLLSLDSLPQSSH